ncbi:transporter family protein [Fulvivirga lutea]|uniref:Transporter n=1 Tax=Fulvivirga lutea TaxID=2810512 RepID=A0A974WJC1_9BACT|nr:hypothetical protein [Fulvivirga lutea]QSE98272.1 hypothetical protein JR347_04110 [Fulvivirga lutea]
MKKLIIFSLLVSIGISSFAGGGWPQEKGKGYFKLGQNAIVADKFYDLEGDIIDITTISLYTTSLYGEYGITDRLTAIAYIPFFVRSTLNEQEFQPSGTVIPGDEINSFGDTDIGIKYGWTPGKKIAFATTLTLGLPLGKTAEGTTDSGDARILQTGDGEFNQMLFADASYSFYPLPLYASIGLGYNNRTDGFSDEIRYSAELGYTVFKNFNAALKLYATKSTNNGDENGQPGGTVFGNNVEYISYGPEISYIFKEHFGVVVSAAYATGGQNLLAAPNYGFGFFYKL